MWVRTLLVSLSVGVFVAACSARVQVDSITSESRLTPEVAARISTDALARACPSCTSGKVFVRNQLLESDTATGEEVKMPAEFRASIGDSYPGAAFIGRNQEQRLLGRGGLPSGGETVVHVGPVRWLAPEVAGVEIGIITASNGYKSAIYQYQNVDGDWVPVSGDDTGIPVTTAVS